MVELLRLKELKKYENRKVNPFQNSWNSWIQNIENDKI